MPLSTCCLCCLRRSNTSKDPENRDDISPSSPSVQKMIRTNSENSVVINNLKKTHNAYDLPSEDYLLALCNNESPTYLSVIHSPPSPPLIRIPCEQFRSLI